MLFTTLISVLIASEKLELNVSESEKSEGEHSGISKKNQDTREKDNSGTAPTEITIEKIGSDLKNEKNYPVYLTLLAYNKFDMDNEFAYYKKAYDSFSGDTKKDLINKALTIETFFKAAKWQVDYISPDTPAKKDFNANAVMISKIENTKISVYIAFRGTRLPSQLGNSLASLSFNDPKNKFLYTREAKYYPKGKVHADLLKLYNTIAPKISDKITELKTKRDKIIELKEKELKEKNKDKTFDIKIAGHSLGGALATLCAEHLAIHPSVLLADDINDSDYNHHNGFAGNYYDMQLITFGSPMVNDAITVGKPAKGLEVGAGFYALVNPAPAIKRYVTVDEQKNKDPISAIPASKIFSTKFSHVGDEIPLESTSNKTQPKGIKETNANNIEEYVLRVSDKNKLSAPSALSAPTTLSAAKS